MKLYTDNKGRWAGTQSDAKQIGAFEQIEVPTDKPTLLEFLNKHSVGGDGFRVDALVAVEVVDPRGAGSVTEVARDC